MSIEPDGQSITAAAQTAADAVWRKEVLPVLSRQPLPTGKPASNFSVQWQNRLSAPFPAEWERGASGKCDARAKTIVFYAYPFLIDRSVLADGEYIGAIWGEVILDPAKNFEPELRLLPAVTAKPDIQGRKPVMPAEWARLDLDVFKHLYSALDYRLLSAMSDKDQIRVPEDLRAYYCQWIDLNGVVTKQIAARQKPFLDWVACENK